MVITGLFNFGLDFPLLPYHSCYQFYLLDGPIFVFSFSTPCNFGHPFLQTIFLSPLVFLLPTFCSSPIFNGRLPQISHNFVVPFTCTRSIWSSRSVEDRLSENLGERSGFLWCRTPDPLCREEFLVFWTLTLRSGLPMQHPRSHVMMYLAPEYFMHGKVNDKIDVYAFGVILLELISGRKPLCTSCPKGWESLVMWVNSFIQGGKLMQLVDPSLPTEGEILLCRRDTEPVVSRANQTLTRGMDGIKNYFLLQCTVASQ